MIRRILATVFLTLLVASPVLAQTGQINGLITDNTGGVVPGATVKAVETATGISRDTVSGADGRYNFTSLRPATYDITAELTGFRSSQRKGVVLQANQNLTANFALELGSLAETVTVSGEAATVDVTSATISEVVDSKRIVELPLQGRQVTRQPRPDLDARLARHAREPARRLAEELPDAIVSLSSADLRYSICNVRATQVAPIARVTPASAPVLSAGVCSVPSLTQKIFAVVAETISPRSLSITASSNSRA